MSDNLDFAVVFKFDRGRSAITEGPEEVVYRWLLNVEQVSMWDVWDRSLGTYETADSFLGRLAEKYKPKAPLTEDDVNRIIDKRVGEILESIGKEAESQAHGLASYEVGELARSAFDVVARLMDNITERLAGND